MLFPIALARSGDISAAGILRVTQAPFHIFQPSLQFSGRSGRAIVIRAAVFESRNAIH